MDLLIDRGYERVYMVGPRWIVIIGDPGTNHPGRYYHPYAAYWISERAPLALGPGAV
jgi:hypothetical protein